MRYEGVREGKAYTKVRFTLDKSPMRNDRDRKLQGKAQRGRVFAGLPIPMPAGTSYEPTEIGRASCRERV